MFTGIVAGRAEIAQTTDERGLRRLVVRFPEGALQGVAVGGSVALDGTCLTVVAVAGQELSFDCIDETLARTTLGQWRPGRLVNFERAARIGDEIGGHLLSGHILGTGVVSAREEREGNLLLEIRAEAPVLRYVFSKGYIGIDGVSLTVGALDRDAGTFQLHLIPETRRVTTLDQRLPGDQVNIEVDSLTQAAVDTVERVLAERMPATRR